MKKLIMIMLMVAPVVNAEQFLEFKKWTDNKGVYHYSNVPRSMINRDGTIKPEYYIDYDNFADPDYLKHRQAIAEQKRQSSKLMREMEDMIKQQRSISARHEREAALKKEIYDQARVIVDRGIVAGEADYITDADADTLRKKRYSMKDKQAEQHFLNEAKARIDAGNLALKENRPDFAWNHGLQLRSLSYQTPDPAISAKLFRRGSELMSEAKKQMDQFRTIVREYESGHTDRWQVSVE